MHVRLVGCCLIFLACITSGCRHQAISVGETLLDGEWSKSLTETKELSTSPLEETDATEGQAEGQFTETAMTESVYYVHVCGEVVHPGVYQLPVGSRVFEAVEAAGGFLDSAAEEQLNLAQPLTDGIQIRIRNREEAAAEAEREQFSHRGTDPFSDGSAQTEADDGRIHLNTASLEELMTLPGIGEVKAKAIMAYREEHGAFSAVEEIMNISGIKNAAFEKIKDLIAL